MWCFEQEENRSVWPHLRQRRFLRAWRSGLRVALLELLDQWLQLMDQGLELMHQGSHWHCQGGSNQNCPKADGLKHHQQQRDLTFGSVVSLSVHQSGGSVAIWKAVLSTVCLFAAVAADHRMPQHCQSGGADRILK